MKPSHYKTPRSMNECCFAMNADPIDYGAKPMHNHDTIILWGCVIAIIALAIIGALYK